MDCLKAGILSHISRICLNDEAVASDDRPHATLAWANNSSKANGLEYSIGKLGSRIQAMSFFKLSSTGFKFGDHCRTVQ
jgi:hypothetical protein